MILVFQVIPAFEEAVSGMALGGIRRFSIFLISPILLHIFHVFFIGNFI